MLIPRTRVKNRRFEYTPRFYDPKEDDRLRQRLRIQSKTRRGKQPAFIAVAILLAVAIYIYTQL